jgi:hypothetical protein
VSGAGIYSQSGAQRQNIFLSILFLEKHHVCIFKQAIKVNLAPQHRMGFIVMGHKLDTKC